jgi:hypothetical protein
LPGCWLHPHHVLNQNKEDKNTLKNSLFDKLTFEELIQISDFKTQLQSTRMLFAGLLAAPTSSTESEQRG